jgi:hypothetical protein
MLWLARHDKPVPKLIVATLGNLRTMTVLASAVPTPAVQDNQAFMGSKRGDRDERTTSGHRSRLQRQGRVRTRKSIR